MLLFSGGIFLEHTIALGLNLVVQITCTYIQPLVDYCSQWMPYQYLCLRHFVPVATVSSFIIPVLLGLRFRYETYDFASGAINML